MARLQALLTCVAAFLTLTHAEYLNLTALTAANNISHLECWQLTQELAASTIAGRIGTFALPLSDFANASYGVIPAKYDGGLHNAPKKQYV